MVAYIVCFNEHIGILDSWNVGVGLGYLALYGLYIAPQIFVLTTTTQKALLAQASYKIMFVTCCVDIVLLVLALAVPVLSFTYIMLRAVLSVNRILQLGRQSLCTMLFGGQKTWFWLAWCFSYGIVLCMGAVQSDPLYYYDNNAGVWKFLWLKSHMITIQTIAVNIVFELSNVFYLLVSYTSLSGVSHIGIIGEVLWATVHGEEDSMHNTYRQDSGSNGYSYVILNRSVQNEITNFLQRAICKRKGNRVDVVHTKVTRMS
uniref:7TM_GPCR_Srx domain-containing protein n=1 Tax=Steinernema glaseri TaxID=37863 RepID=A0A1I7ZNS3_9BILA